MSEQVGSRFDWTLWLQWVLATTIGWGVVGGVFEVGTYLDTEGLPLTIFVSGVSVGGLQWFCIRRFLSSAERWVYASAVGWAITNGLAVTLFPLAAILDVSVGPFIDDLVAWIVLLLVLMVSSTGVGVAQWFVLRREVESAGRWILTNGIGFAAACFIAFSFISTESFLLNTSLLGLVNGAITGLVLVRTLQKPLRTQEHSIAGREPRLKPRIVFLTGIGITLLSLVAGRLLGHHEGAKALNAINMKKASPTWVHVPLPDGQRPTHFMESDAPIVHVVTSQGKSFTQPSFYSIDSWQELPAGEEIKNNHHGHCVFHQTWRGEYEIPEPPSAVVERIYCSDSATGGYGSVCQYVILDNGQLWRWRMDTCWSESCQDHEEISAHFTYSMTVSFYTVWGGLLGLLLFGLLMWTVKRLADG